MEVVLELRGNCDIAVNGKFGRQHSDSRVCQSPTQPRFRGSSDSSAVEPGEIPYSVQTEKGSVSTNEDLPWICPPNRCFFHVMYYILDDTCLSLFGLSSTQAPPVLKGVQAGEAGIGGRYYVVGLTHE